MLYKAGFKVNLFDLGRVSDPEDYLNQLRKSAARDIGIELCKDIPFAINKEKSKFRRMADLNDFPPINPKDAAEDYYETAFFAASLTTWTGFKRELDVLMKEGNGKISRYELVNLIGDLERKV